MTLLYLALAYAMAVTAGGLFMWCMCIVARRDDDAKAEALARRQKAQENEANAHIYGGPSGWEVPMTETLNARISLRRELNRDVRQALSLVEEAAYERAQGQHDQAELLVDRAAARLSDAVLMAAGK